MLSKPSVRLFLLAILPFALFPTHSNSQNEKLEILVNNQPFNPEENTVKEESVITLRLINTDPECQYLFNLVDVEWLIKKNILDSNNKESRAKYFFLKQTQKARRKIKRARGKHDLEFWNPKGYKEYSRDGTMSFYFKEFKTECLSRVVLHLKDVIKKKGTEAFSLNINNLGLPRVFRLDGISFYPEWVTCTDVIKTKFKKQ